MSEKTETTAQLHHEEEPPSAREMAPTEESVACNEEALEALTQRPKICQLPLDEETLAQLRAGDWLQLDGTVFLVGPQTRQRLLHEEEPGEGEEEEQGETSSLEWEEQTVFYAVSGPAPHGKVIGSISPEYTPDYGLCTQKLLQAGVRFVLGRGPLDVESLRLLKRKRGAYLVVPGGASALLARSITQSQKMAYAELAGQALRKLKLCGFPCVVAVDAFGRTLFSSDALPTVLPPVEEGEKLAEQEDTDVVDEE